MEPFPHLYRVNASGAAAGPIRLASGSLVEIESAAPAEFGGPGDRWSPENS